MLAFWFDKNNPDSIALHGICIGGYVLSASDENYDWEFVVDWEWEGTEEEFFSHSYATQARTQPQVQTQSRTLDATLGNFFDHNFGYGNRLPAFDLAPEQHTYQFRADEEKEIEVTVSFLLDKETFRILDVESNLDFWRMRIVDSTGQRILAPQIEIGESRHQSDIQSQVIEIRKSHPYTRTINIGSLYDFAGDGEYKVQLVYYTPSLDNPDPTAWLGSFTSPVFTVTIN